MLVACLGLRGEEPGGLGQEAWILGKGVPVAGLYFPKGLDPKFLGPE